MKTPHLQERKADGERKLTALVYITYPYSSYWPKFYNNPNQIS